MSGLVRAAFLLAVGLALQLSVPRGAHLIPEGLVLPSTARLILEGPDEQGRCSSPYLPYALTRWTIGPLVVGDAPYDGRMDYELRCRSEDGVMRLTVFDRRGTRVTEASHAGDGASAAIVVAAALRKDPALARSVMALYQSDARASAHLAAEQWAKGEWRKAADNFFFALEGGVNPPVMYYGLYESHAKLGEFALAYWYLLCYLKADGKTPQALQARQLAALKGIDATRILREAVAGPVVRPRALFAAREGRTNELVHMLLDAAKETPWDERLPRQLARIYERRGWDELAGEWRERAELAAEVNASLDVQTGLLAVRLAR